LGEGGRFAPGAFFGCAGEEQEIAYEITDGEGAEELESEEREADGDFGKIADESVEEDTGVERGVEGDPDAGDEEEGVDDAEHEISEHGAGGAGIAEGRRPTDTDEEDGEDGGEGAEEDDVTGDGEEGLFLDDESRAESLPEADVGIGREGDDGGEEQVKGEAGKAPSGHTEDETEVEEVAAADPDDGDEERGEPSDHGVVIGGGDAVDEGEAGEPTFAFVDAEFEEAPNEVGEEEEIEHGARAGGGMFPEGEVEAEDGGGEDGWQPGGGDAEEGEVAAFAVTLIAGAVVWEEGDGAGKECEGEGSAGSGDEVEGEELGGMREPAEWKDEEEMERCVERR
jgi:hypothetical protein